MTPTEILDRDEAIAKAATEGPWRLELEPGQRLPTVCGVTEEDVDDRICSVEYLEEDATYIAHFNPAYVLKLIEVAREASYHAGCGADRTDGLAKAVAALGDKP